MKDSLKVAVCQMTSVDDVARNCDQILKLLENANGAELVIFPENALYLRINKDSSMPGLNLGSECFSNLKESALKMKTTILVGSAPMLEESGRISNATVLITPSSVEVVYRKIHLFDVDVAGSPSVRESDSFQHGSETNVLEIAGWKLGLSICYDLRFSELYARYAKLNVDAILVPSAFLVPTGMAHWHVLLRARAIESQAYVIAPAQAGEHKSETGSRKTFGHSLVVDPWGEVICDIAETGPKVEICELKRERLDWVRRQIPQAGHRRL